MAARQDNCSSSVTPCYEIKLKNKHKKLEREESKDEKGKKERRKTHNSPLALISPRKSPGRLGLSVCPPRVRPGQLLIPKKCYYKSIFSTQTHQGEDGEREREKEKEKARREIGKRNSENEERSSEKGVLSLCAAQSSFMQELIQFRQPDFFTNQLPVRKREGEREKAKGFSSGQGW